MRYKYILVYLFAFLFGGIQLASAQCSGNCSGTYDLSGKTYCNWTQIGDGSGELKVCLNNTLDCNYVDIDFDCDGTYDAFWSSGDADACLYESDYVSADGYAQICGCDDADATVTWTEINSTGCDICDGNTECDCTDGNDNDGDGDTDCADTDCAYSPNCGNLCENAIDISSEVGSSVCGSTEGKSNDGDDGSSSCSSIDQEMWFKFTATDTSMTFDFTQFPGGTYEPTVTLYSGSCGGSLTELGCQDYNLGNRLSYNDFTPGNTYYMSVDGYSSETGSFCFDFYETPDLNTNDDYLWGAQVIDQCGTTFSSTTAGHDGEGCGSIEADLDCNPNTTSGSSQGDEVDFSIENDQWYTFCPNATGTWEYTLNNITNCNTMEGVQTASFQGWPDSLHTRFGTSGSGMGSDLEPGDSYTETMNITDLSDGCVYIMIDGYAGTECDFDVSVTCTDCGCALAVGLVRFEGHPHQHYNLLEWTTVTEKQNDYFIVERSLNHDHSTFHTIGTVDGAGNSHTTHHYTFKDRELPESEQMVYYRLKAVEEDGDASTSSVVGIDNRSFKSSLTIDRIQTRDQKQVVHFSTVTSGEVTLIIRDLSGATIQRKQVNVSDGHNSSRISTSALSTGMYVMTIKSSDGRTVHRKFVQK